MANEAPPFWWEPADWRARALQPVSWLYGLAARYRLEHAPRVPVAAPVLCIGNFTVGGSGKTPVAISMAGHARSRGLRPGFLSRGYGGHARGAHRVDPEHDSPRLVGDEPLLLARHAPTVVSRDRIAGARLLIEAGADLIIMDDGFQSARIHMDYALLVVDATRGIGNGFVLPGGPLRAPLVAQLSRADALLVVGSGRAADPVVRQAARAGRPIYAARLRPAAGRPLSGRRFLAFAGIGNPARFFDSVSEAGGWVSATRAFPDHHFYADDELSELAATARSAGLELVTTVKDAVRLQHGSQQARALLEELTVLDVEVAFELETTPGRILEETLAGWRRRRLTMNFRAA
jgi:tetraacyldisaccharide 4'-kinase